MTDAFIVFFALLAVFFAGLLLTLRQPMRAALALIAHMISLAAIFACLAVHVVALFQLLIYVGAVMVFMIYTIMLLDDRDSSYRQRYSRPAAAALVVTAVVAAMLLLLVGQPSADAVAAGRADPAAASIFGFGAFSVDFLRHYWFHFEVATVLLLVGMVAAWTAIRECR
jgi:NADH-quinone oxidoreductase subunit J